MSVESFFRNYNVQENPSAAANKTQRTLFFSAAAISD